MIVLMRGNESSEIRSEVRSWSFLVRGDLLRVLQGARVLCGQAVAFYALCNSDTGEPRRAPLGGPPLLL